MKRSFSVLAVVRFNEGVVFCALTVRRTSDIYLERGSCSVTTYSIA
jgi:hypothetical protein